MYGTICTKRWGFGRAPDHRVSQPAGAGCVDFCRYFVETRQQENLAGAADNGFVGNVPLEYPGRNTPTPLLIMKPATYLLTMTTAAICLAASARITHAAVSLTNGSFESTGALYLNALGGINEATGWTNLTGNPGVLFQAGSTPASNPPNPEFTSAPGSATGLRYLRLAADPGGSAIWGVTAQNVGTMLTGETYILLGDIFAGPSDGGQLYGARISFANQVSATPSTIYATQTVDLLNNGFFGADAFNFSYTATAADNGQPLVVLIEALPNGNNTQSRRGGIDNLRLNVVPEPSAAMLGGLAGLALLRRRRA